jgi:hypothetical protein
MFNKPITFSLAIFFFLSVTKLIVSQELDPTVDCNFEKVGSDARDRLANFKQEVTDYLSKTRFTDENIINDVRGKPYKIKCNFTIFFTTSQGFDYYEAQVVVSAQRIIYKTANFSQLIRFRDDVWQFNYIKGQSMLHDDSRFNNLTSFLDYYAYMIIGFDDDSWELKLGAKRFQKAQDVVNMAIANNVTTGWSDNTTTKSSRITFPLEIQNSKYDNFRKGLWMYHFAGVDSIQYNRRQALDRVKDALELIALTKKTEVRSFTIKAFFDSKYLEIAQIMLDYYDRSYYRRLGEIDPEHISTYDEYSKK